MNSKKIGITTITVKGAYNYGNKLQTYALQRFLRENGYEAETIRYEASYIRGMCHAPRRRQWRKLFSQSIVQSLDDMIRIMNRMIHKNKLTWLCSKRASGFESFEQNNMAYTEETYYHDSPLADLQKNYDCFVTGSDQVWNPYYEGMDPFFYLHYAEKGKRIAYAPSIAVEEIPEALKSDIGQWIRDIDYLSIRETGGKELLAREFGVEAQLVCDPVFLLSRGYWQEISNDSISKDRYFAVYLLGKKTISSKRTIQKLEKLFGIPAVDIYTRDDPSSMFASPEEFLGLIKNADFVVTDSFHGTAFSVIFEVPMVLLNRASVHKMGSRIESLLLAIGAGDRSADLILKDPDRLPMDYGACNEKLKPLTDASKAYLLSAVRHCTENN